jgi:hypothetical protein
MLTSCASPSSTNGRATHPNRARRPARRTRRSCPTWPIDLLPIVTDNNHFVGVVTLHDAIRLDQILHSIGDNEPAAPARSPAPAGTPSPVADHIDVEEDRSDRDIHC